MNKYRSVIASVLAVVMLLSLAACGAGGSQGGEGGGQSGGKTQGGKTGKDSAPAFVYTSTFTDVKNEDNAPMNAVCFTSEGFYTTGSDVVGRREPEEGETEQYAGQFDILAETLSFVSYDGRSTKLTNYVPLDPGEEEGHTKGCSLTMLCADDSGTLAGFYHCFDNWNDAPEGLTEEDDAYWNYWHWEETWYLRMMQSDGTEISICQLDPNGSGWFYPYGAVFADGKIFLASNDGLYIISPDGSNTSSVSLEGYVNSIFRMRDGSVGMLYYDNVGGINKLALLDTKSGKISKTFAAPHNAYSFIDGAGDYDAYFVSGISLFGYVMETEQTTKLFDWLNVDVLSGELSGFTVRGDGSVFAVTNSWDSNRENVTTEFVCVEKKAWDDVPHRTELTLACHYADTPLQSAVVKYNRNSDVRIVVTDYSQYDTDEDWGAGLTKLRTEILAGNVPDIICFSGLPYRQLAAKGLLEDLYPYIDADKELDRSDFMPNVLRALEDDGKLYTTFSTFYISTLVGAPSVVGAEPGWTFDEMTAALATMPEGCTVLDQYTTSGDILRTAVTLDMDSYINWNTGECNFDSKAFIDTLNFAAMFPNSFDWNSYDWTEYESTDARIAAGKQMCLATQLGSFYDLIYTEGTFGGDLTFIGYPCASGTGSLLQIDSGYGMSSKCADKEAAWQFLRMFLTEKGSESFGGYYYGFPARRDLLDKMLKDAMTTEYMKDEKGNFVLDDDGNKIPIVKGAYWTEGSDEPVELYALTQGQADKVMELIETTDKLGRQDDTILSIILEEAEPFFAGRQSAEETARIIQGKLSIYVNEQR